MTRTLNPSAPTRMVTEVGPGDYVKVRGVWEPIIANTAHGADRTPRQWTVTTPGGSYGMYDIDRYAKAGDFE